MFLSGGVGVSKCFLLGWGRVVLGVLSGESSKFVLTSNQSDQRLDKALRERQTADKKKQEQLTSTLSQAVTNSITGKLDKTLKHEMKNNVIPTIQKVLTPIQEQLNTTMAQV